MHRVFNASRGMNNQHSNSDHSAAAEAESDEFQFLDISAANVVPFLSSNIHESPLLTEIKPINGRYMEMPKRVSFIKSGNSEMNNSKPSKSFARSNSRKPKSREQEIDAEKFLEASMGSESSSPFDEDKREEENEEEKKESATYQTFGKQNSDEPSAEEVSPNASP